MRATYLVTGVAGFIGSALAAALLERGERVRGIDNFATGKRENLERCRGIEFIEGDVADPAEARRACASVGVVFHEAAIPSVPRSVAEPLENNRANLDATVNLLVEARAAGVERFIYAASSAAYGNDPALPKHEDMTPAPLSPYAAAKVAGEHYLAAFHASYGLTTVSLRYFNVFGPYQDANSPYSGVLARFIHAMLAGSTPQVFGDGEQSRDFVYIDNVVAANLLAADAAAERVGGQTINVGMGERISLNQILELLRPMTGCAGEVRYGAERAGDVRHSVADISRSQELLGFRPQVSFAEGLKRTVAWYRQATVVAARNSS
ncbi:MAG: NAD-dependent epimerase/dehydratase family protein [Acidobacteria bacterium]|nr:MAG: NAD-dependent epimerase/dehydratase family protein [Acidobacteriota bacterium]